MDFRDLTQEERLDAYFSEFVLPTTKDEILHSIDEKLKLVGDGQKLSDCTEGFRSRYLSLMERFRRQVEETNLFEKLEPYWHYEILADEFGVRLNLLYVADIQFDDFDEDGEPALLIPETPTAFTLITTPAKMLTVEDFAEANGTSVTTVRQWIRRGKIRAVVKNGNTWMISELAEISPRGYQPRLYNWHCHLDALPKEYEFLNKGEYRSVEIKQSAGTKDTFDITIWPGDNTIQMQTKEKERFELFLLAHPLVEAHTHYIF